MLRNKLKMGRASFCSFMDVQKHIPPGDGGAASSLLVRIRGRRAFALYEVLIGVAIFAIGILALGRAVENCLNASVLVAEEDRVRQVLSNRMAEIQATPGLPDVSKEIKVETGYGMVRIIQKVAPVNLKENDADVTGINRVSLTAKWKRGGAEQSKLIEFYVYRTG